MPSGLEHRVEVLEQKVDSLEKQVGKNTEKLSTVEWDADHIGAKLPDKERKEV